MKRHIRLRCKLAPLVPRLGTQILLWRADVLLDGAFTDYGAWFSNSAKALEASVNREDRAEVGSMKFATQAWIPA